MLALKAPEDAVLVGKKVVVRAEQTGVEEPTLADPLIRLGDILRGRERFAEAAEVYDAAVTRIGILKKHHWSLGGGFKIRFMA